LPELWPADGSRANYERRLQSTHLAVVPAAQRHGDSEAAGDAVSLRRDLHYSTIFE